MGIVPNPNGPWVEAKGSLQLPKICTVNYGGFATYCTEKYFERSGIFMEEVTESAVLQLIRDATLAPEEYHIRVDSGIRITAATEKGVIWALTSLFLETQNGVHKQGELKDKPRYSFRGFHFDCARHFFSVETVERILDVAGLSKLNHMHWHLTNDQGWRIESTRYPLLTSTGSYYTQTDIRRIVSYARKCGIEIIPEINVPGHTSAILAAYPQFGCFEKTVPLRASGGIYPVILCGGKEETLTFIKNILTETSELFPCEFFHVGGDEAPKTEWEKCPHCKTRMEENNITEIEELQGWLLSQVSAHLASLGKRTICWNDGFLESNFSDNVIVQYWTKNVKTNHAATYWKQGGNVIFSDALHCYFDYPIAMTNLKRVYSYVPKLDKTNCSDAKNTLGIECCLWTEGIETPEQIGQRLFPRLFAIAEIGWSKQRNYANFEQNLAVMLHYLDKQGLSHMPLSESNLKGKARREQVAQYFMAVSEHLGTSEGSVALDRKFLLKTMFKIFGLSAIPLFMILLKGQK